MNRKARAFLVFFLAALGVGAVVFFKREVLTLDYFASRIKPSALSAREEMLAPFIEFRAPKDRPPPYPVVIQFHGCAGMRENFMRQWADAANAAGYMAVIVDSLRPRGIGRERALATVCHGKELVGEERVGDVLAATDIVRKRSDVDKNRIVLAGWSHGGWSIMDFIALNAHRKAPPGIYGGAPHENIAGVILIYPYCGFGGWARILGWPKGVPTLALIAGDDRTVDPRACPALLSRFAQTGAAINLHVYPDADHVFDDPYLEPQYIKAYNAKDHADAARRYRAFLEKIAARGR